MARNIILHLGNIFLEFGGPKQKVKVLKGITLDIIRGSSVAILGPSGSGKSSLLAIMTGLEQQSSGSVTVNGHMLDDMNEDGLALFRRDNIGIVLQSFHLLPTMTALENVAVPLELAVRKDAFEVASCCLDDVGLSDRYAHYPAQLSGGEQQRVAIARAMAPDPAIIFADEPTGNLDSETGHKIIELMFDMQKKSGTTLIMITHDREIAKHCDHILYLQDGRLITEKDQSEILKKMVQ